MLANRHINVRAQCPVCLQGAKDMRHLMFTCQRAKEVWKSLGLLDAIKEALIVDRSGSVVLEEFLRKEIKLSPNLCNLGFNESISVGAWYIWWQRRESVKGNSVAPPERSAFAIQALTANFAKSLGSADPRKITWERPHTGC